MEKNQTILLVLLILLQIFLFMSWVSKAANWDEIDNKSWVRNTYPEVFPGEEGLIVVDIFLTVAYAIGIYLTCRPNRKASIFLIVFLVIMLFIRFILSMLFLAGDGNFVHKLINDCNNQPIYNPYYYSGWCGSEIYRSIKAAWGIEVMSVIVINVLSAGGIYMLFKSSGASSNPDVLLAEAVV